MVTMLGAIYEFERANLLERQKDGIMIAKRQGKYKGRKKILKPANWSDVYNDWITRKITAKKACELLKLKTNTFYNFVKEEVMVKAVFLKKQEAENGLLNFR